MCAAYLKVENKLVTCPYDSAHKLKESRLQKHITICKQNHLDKPKDICPFNATHLFSPADRDYHLLNCPDRVHLDRKLAQTLDKNNPFKGNTAVPRYSEPPRVECEESWDEELAPPGNSYLDVQKTPPPNAIIEPPPLSKPSERRKLYQELHRMQNVPEKNTKVSPMTIPRQPMQPSETQKMQSVQKQQHNVQAIQNLGYGRGRPQRIAANFNNATNIEKPQSSTEISGVIKSLNNIGLGRAQQHPAVPILDDDEFPMLGIGRGVSRGPRPSPRAPGAKPN